MSYVGFDRTLGWILVKLKFTQINKKYEFDLILVLLIEF